MGASVTDAVRTFVWCMGIVVFKLMFIAFATGFKRSKTGSPATPEDAALVGGSSDGDFNEGGTHPDVQRFLNLHRNTIENVLLFVITNFVFATGSFKYADEWFAGAWIAFNVIWTVVRVAYTVCYIFALQPYRTICFALGQFMIFLFTFWGMITVLITRHVSTD
mmetsp:Transcript_16321/g.24343  ORF Transcript_16321/g.24343 Transcript_16321/m.24343 type:complete len:164 (+) Transcript_16321:48-539(+)|eukprot:CAMPEP_0201544796 /NCGR_PEP_ID=MMETSP0173_2-20130828/1418_1 /ASSEMBLY_ACC=CAM_ASM_000268 /TAXON_ID=218659 /ORGANISM="Vexillifera sp., Strain DIVA3 564/2" /LENGTH=163 /DNA_ID=CAMNT_0047953051 /DNA_START=48 /DNA_END=539 /DNA_ORIENTATION=-